MFDTNHIPTHIYVHAYLYTYYMYIILRVHTHICIYIYIYVYQLTLTPSEFSCMYMNVYIHAHHDACMFILRAIDYFSLLLAPLRDEHKLAAYIEYASCAEHSIRSWR
jgi:hypothetical protein